MDVNAVIDELRGLLIHRGLAFRKIHDGLAIEFEDECDALIISERQINKLGLRGTPEEVAKSLLDRYESLNPLRAKILIALRHHAKNLKVAIDRRSSGQWNLETQGGCSSCIDVGSRLTHYLATRSLVDSFRTILQESMLRVPSEKRAERLLHKTEVPEQELEFKNIVDQEIQIRPEALAFDCSVFEDPDFQPKDADELKNALMPHQNDIGLTVVKELTARIGQDRFTFDWCNKNVADFEFSDELDRFRVRVRGKQMDKLLAQHGQDGSVNYLASEFARLDRARENALKAIDALMSKRGFIKDSASIDQDWWYGKTHRTHKFNPGNQLTRWLRRQSPAELILEWCEKEQVEPSATIEEIEGIIEGPTAQPNIRSLPIDSPDKGPKLLGFSEIDLQYMDERAADLLQAFKQHCEAEGKAREINQQDPLWRWSDRLWYVRGNDTWVDEAWWLRQARYVWQISGGQSQPIQGYWLPYQQAALIMLVNGDNEPREMILEQCREMEYYHDEALIDGLAWLLFDELTFEIEEGDISEYPYALGPLPATLARQTALDIREALNETSSEDDPKPQRRALDAAANLDPQSAADWLTSQEVDDLHEVCLEWASSNESYYDFWSDEPLLAAANFGWSDVVDVLAQNPAIVPAMLQWDTKRMHLGEYAQHLSLVNPGQYAARWAAHAMAMDIESEAESTAESIATGIGSSSSLSQFIDMPDMAETWRANHLKSLREQQMAAAIAWHRCREANVR